MVATPNRGSCSSGCLGHLLGQTNSPTGNGPRQSENTDLAGLSLAECLPFRPVRLATQVKGPSEPTSFLPCSGRAGMVTWGSATWGRLVLPKLLQAKVLQGAHMGHPGMVQMKQKLCDSYWWPRLDTQVEIVVRSCPGCQMSSKSHPPDPIPLISVPKPTLPWKRLGLNISGPFATAPQNKQFVISVADYCSGYPEILISMDIWSSAIIHWLKELFTCYRCLDEVVMDNGPQFASSEFQQFLSEYGICALMIFVYNPRENGLVERWNTTLKFSVQAFCSSGKKWEDGIPELLTQHRHMPASAPWPSPAQILFGRKMHMAFEVLLLPCWAQLLCALTLFLCCKLRASFLAAC